MKAFNDRDLEVSANFNENFTRLDAREQKLKVSLAAELVKVQESINEIDLWVSNASEPGRLRRE